ncbi:MAG: rod shape-determining protein MreC [Candidatus Parcubacteria bacterium]|jgi:cell shape-determining protein MreC
MTYHQRNKSKYRGYRFVIILFVILLIFRIFNVRFVTQIFDGPINYILESHTATLSPFKNTLVYFKSKKDLSEQVKQLQSENTNLKLENLLQQTQTQEFEYFKNQFGTTTASGMYRVILKPPFIPFDNIRIAGNLESKQVGDLVFYKNVLIGKLTEKDNNYATAELFSTPDKVTAVAIKGTQFEAKGLGGGRFVLEASKEFDVNVGDPIIYPDQTLLIIGAVEFVESKEEDLFKKVYFNVPIPIASISHVGIGIK